METMYDLIKKMSKDELGKFIRKVYNKGWFDYAMSVDDEAVFCGTMLDYPASFNDEYW